MPGEEHCGSVHAYPWSWETVHTRPILVSPVIADRKRLYFLHRFYEPGECVWIVCLEIADASPESKIG